MAAKLASGYVELTVKFGDAMKEITNQITGLGKEAEKSGQQIGAALNKGLSDSLKKNAGKSGNSLAEDILLGKSGGSTSSTATKAATKAGEDVGKSLGEALNKGVTQGAKDAGKSIDDELSKATKKVGDDAGKQVGDALNKGISKGAKDAGKQVADEITAATKQAGKQVEQVEIEPKITPKVDTKAAKKEAQSIPEIIADTANKAAKSNGYDGLEDVLVEGMDKAGRKAGEVLGTKIGEELHDHLGVDLGGVATKVGDTLTAGLGDVDFASVLTNTLDRGLKASSGDLVTGLGKRLGKSLGDQIGSALHDQVTNLTGIDPADVPGRLHDARGVIGAFRGGDIRGGAGGAANLLDALGIPGGGTANEVLNTYDQGKSVLDQIGGLAQEFGGESIAAALAGPEFLIPAAAGALGLVGGRYLIDKSGVMDPKYTRTDTTPEALGIPRVPEGPNQVPTPAVPVPGLPTDSRFPAVMPTMNKADLPSIAPLDMPDDPKNPTGRTGINYVINEPSGGGGGTSNVSAQVADVTAGSAVVQAGSVSLGGNITLPSISIPTSASAPSSVASALPNMPAAPAHPTVAVPGRGTVPINPLDILAPTDRPKGHAKGTGPAGVSPSGRLFGPGTGTSDSILGLDSSGIPTAMVSAGEGVVNDNAMRNGGGTLVGALNAGWTPSPDMLQSMFNLPGHDDGQPIDPQAAQALQALQNAAGKPGGMPLPPPPANGEAPKVGTQLPTAVQQQLADMQPPPAAPPGAPVDPAAAPAGMAATADPAGFAQRTQGYIPAGAGGAGQAGSSFASGLYQMGASAINGLIDQAASAASSAVSVGVNAVAPGAGSAAGGAAGSAIGIGTQAAKRGVQYGAQLLGIGTDALAEILMPFGVPRFFQTDPTQFMPKWATQPTAVTTGEKAQLAQTPEAQSAPGLQPGGPVQPGQLPGAQPVGAPVQFAQPQGVASAAAPIGQLSPEQAPVPPPVGGPAVPNPQGESVAPAMPKSGPLAAPQPPPQDPQQPPKPNDILGSIAGVYDNGGWLQPGGVAINQSSQLEPMPVFSGTQWSTLTSIANSPMGEPSQGGGHDYSVNIDNVTVKDVDELQAQLNSRQRLQMMRHAGRP